MASGWVYCIGNPGMPGMVKIGMTTRTPEERLAEANALGTWLPWPFSLKKTVKVTDCRLVERAVHCFLETCGHRVNPRREFFSLSEESIDCLFTLISTLSVAHIPETATAKTVSVTDNTHPVTFEDDTDTDDNEEDDDNVDIIQHVKDEPGPTKTKIRISCICCDWVGISPSFPQHVLRHHTDSLYLSKKQFDNCTHLHLSNGEETVTLTACLVCKKGTVASPYGGNGARWITCHSENTSCRELQAAKLTELNLPVLKDE